MLWSGGTPFAGDIIDVLVLAFEANRVPGGSQRVSDAVESVGLHPCLIAALDVVVSLRAGEIRRSGQVSPEDAPVKRVEDPKPSERVRFDQYLEVALGGLDWTGPQFWDSTFAEFACAVNGKQRSGSGVEPIVGDQYEKLKRDALDHRDKDVAAALAQNRSIRSAAQRAEEKSFIRKHITGRT